MWGKVKNVVVERVYLCFEGGRSVTGVDATNWRQLRAAMLEEYADAELKVHLRGPLKKVMLAETDQEQQREGAGGQAFEDKGSCCVVQ